MIAAGIIGGLCAAIFGFAIGSQFLQGTRAKRIGLLQGATNILVVLLFIASSFMRQANGQIPTTGALVLSFISVALAFVGGWLGGELVDRLGVGVDEGANLNAPNSLLRSSSMATGDPVQKAS